MFRLNHAKEQILPIVVRNTQSLLPLAYMISAEIAKLRTSGATSDDVNDVQVKMAYTLGLVVFGETFARITGNLAKYHAMQEAASGNLEYAVNLYPTIASLIFGAASAILATAMFVAGEKMEKAGPWLITCTAIIAYMTSQFTFKRATAAMTTPTQNTADTTRLQKMIAFAGTPIGAIATLSPVVIAELLDRIYLEGGVSGLSNKLGYISDSLWALTIIIKTALTAAAASNYLSHRIIDMTRMMIKSSVIALGLLITLTGHPGKTMDYVAPFGARFLGLISIGLSVAINQLQATAASSNSDPVPGVEHANRGLHLLAMLGQDIGVPTVLAAHALTTHGPQSELFRKTMEIVLGFNLADSVLSGAFSHPRANSDWANPAFLLLGLQIASYIPTVTDWLPTQVTPFLGIINAIAYLLYKQALALHGQNQQRPAAGAAEEGALVDGNAAATTRREQVGNRYALYPSNVSPVTGIVLEYAAQPGYLLKQS